MDIIWYDFRLFNFYKLSENDMIIFKNKQHIISYEYIVINPSIYGLNFNLDYDALKYSCSIYKEELIQKALHPSRIQKYLIMGYEIDELDNIL